MAGTLTQVGVGLEGLTRLSIMFASDPMKPSPFTPLAVLLGLAAATGLSRGREEAERQVPQFRTQVNAVLVDALVLNRDGNPVEDLTRRDFQLFEDGVEQSIASFDVTDWTSYVAAQTGASPGEPSALQENKYPRRFVFVLNRQGTRFDYLVRAKRALSSFVVESLADGDEAMVIDMGNSTKIVQQFVADKQTTLASIDSIRPMAMPYRMEIDRAARAVYQDIESLARAFAEIPGRKIVVLFSMELMTFPPPGSTLTNETFTLKRTVEALNQSNTSVYAIDLAGVDSRGASSYGGLSALALDTGGRFYRNAVAFGPPLERIGRENQRYYLLGYVSTNAAADGSYRKIELRVDRPDVEVVARPGYFARKEDTQTDVADAREAPDTAPSARGDAAASDALPLAVEITTYLLPTGTGKVRVPMSVALPEELLTGKGGSERELMLTVADEQGKAIESFEQSVDVPNYFLVKQADLDPGLYMLTITVRSEEQELYRASQGLQIPAGFGDRFGLSSVIPVVSPEATQAVGPGLPLLPTPSVERGADAFLVFQVFSGKDQPARRARISYAVFDDKGEILNGGRDEPLELKDLPGGTPVVLSVPTRSLDYGRYRIEVRVEDPDAGRRASSDIELRIR